MLTDEIKQVIAGLPEDAFAADGKPKVKDLEAAYAAAYPDAEAIDISAADRDALWIEFNVMVNSETPDGMHDAPTGRLITITASPTNPLKIIVNGRILAVLQVGEPATVDPIAFAHMSKMDGVTFTEGQI